MDTATSTDRPDPPKSLWPPLPALMRLTICLFALVLSISVLHAQNAIQIENAKQGDASWRATNLANTQPPGYTDKIEGYASLTSVNRGGQITFYVNVTTPGDSFTINIYRIGWYAGLGARKVLSIGPLLGVQQPMPVPDPTTGLIECNWASSYTLTLDNTTDPVSNWISGVYIGLLTDTNNGLQRYMTFVVRDDASTSNYFFQCAVDTYQAYNNWGGKSLYAFDSANNSPATKVSFNRPYKTSYGYEGTGDFLTGWEYDTVRFLEREGYDVTYGTDLDAHEHPNLLLSHKAVLIVGHSEYWSMAMRNNIIAARDNNKVSMGIFAGDVCYWQVRFEASLLTGAADRTMVGYKDFATTFTAPGPDPYYAACTGTGVPIDTSKCPLVTVQWRQPPVNMPENSFIGVMFHNSPVNGDILVPDASNWVFTTTGLRNDGTLPGLLGYEVDSLFNNGLTPMGYVTLAASPYTTTGTNPTPGTSNMTVYTAASGATVFAAGSIQFGWGLDDFSLVLGGENGRVSFAAQQMTRNLLANFIGDQPPVANPGGPYTGATLQSIQFDATGSSAPAGTIVTYQWDFGDGTTGTGSSPTHDYAVAGTYNITLIVTDSQGSRNAATTTATISGTGAAPTASVAPVSLSFGDQLVGTTSAAQPMTLRNTGTAPLTIASLVVTGDFAETNNCAGSVAAGGSCTITVTFTPMAAGPRKSSIVIAENAVGSPDTIITILTGVGTAASLSPGSLTFASQTVGTASTPQVITLTNVGASPMNIWQTAFLGTNATDFSEISTCGSTLGAGVSCTISVTFTPGAAGTRTASLLVSDDGGGSPQAVLLTGTGAAAAVPATLLQTTTSTPGTSTTVSGTGTTIFSSSSGLGTGTNGAHAIASLSASSLSFGKQEVETSSSPQSVLLTNTGGATLTIKKVEFSGSGRNDFAQTSDCGPSLAAGSRCTLQITFTPHAPGTRKAAIIIQDDASDGPHQVRVEGVGVRSERGRNRVDRRR